MSTSLSFDQAPPISVPLRFFLTAPMFGIIAGLLLIFEGGDALSNRFHPTTLGLTHLLVAGFLLQIMAGALFQFVPVVTGGNVRRPLLTGSLVHLCLSVGTPLLVLAFLRLQPDFFTGAALLLGLGLGLLVTIVGMALLGASAKGDTLPALRAALLSLLPTAGLGVALALTLAGLASGNIPSLLEAHQSWGLAGWSLTLLAGVSWSVVPMFQITPAYPRNLTRSFVPVMLAALALVSAGLLLGITSLIVLGKALLLLLAATFAGTTLWLQKRAKRKTNDSTRIFFRLAMVALLLFCVTSFGLIATPLVGGEETVPAQLAVALGILLILGVFASAICGMLYKIVPFLVWLHLQGKLPKGITPPNITRMIAPTHSRYQLYAHLLCVALLLPSPWFPILAKPGGFLLALSCSGLLWNLVSAVRVYRQFISRSCADAPHPEC